MIPMQMTDENVIDPGNLDFVLSCLDLHAFAAVQQQTMLPKSNDLGSVISSMHRDGRGIS